MEPKQRILITLAIGVFIVLSFFLITEAITKFTGLAIKEKTDIDDFKVCLREKDITLYINTEDLTESLKDIGLQDYLEDVKIFNCLRNNKICLNKGISFFPSWKIGNIIISRDINIGELERYSNCELVK